VFAFREARGAVEVAFTDRRPLDGSGAALDLAEPTEKRPRPRGDLDRSIAVLAVALARGGEPADGEPLELPAGADVPAVARMRQVHGSEVHTVGQQWLAERSGPGAVDPPEVDGLVSSLPGVALLVRVADCVPVLLADVDRGVIGAAHAGRNGLVAGVVPRTVARMRDQGAQQVTAWVGPHICGRCYEVPETMREEVSSVVPEAFAETSWGTPAVDVGAGVKAQLLAADATVVEASRCTLESEDLFSHRRDAARAGRLGGAVWVRP
jgi:polyphenol oxidase